MFTHSETALWEVSSLFWSFIHIIKRTSVIIFAFKGEGKVKICVRLGTQGEGRGLSSMYVCIYFLKTFTLFH